MVNKSMFKKIILLALVVIFVILFIFNVTGSGVCPCNYCRDNTDDSMDSSSESITIVAVASGDGDEDPGMPNNGGDC